MQTGREDVTTNTAPMLDQIAGLAERAHAAIADASSAVELEAVRVHFLGRKGELSRVMSGVAALAPDQRPTVGNAANTAKAAMETQINARGAELSALELDHRLQQERVDVTLPGTPCSTGYHHPLLQAMHEVVNIFVQMGYEVIEGPEAEWDDYNFTKLNMPANHPARDMWDTFYLTSEIVLRTHTSPAQARIMEQRRPPIRVIVPGRCYRNEAEDASHGAQFMQVEGLVVDQNITMGDLKGTLGAFGRAYFGPDRTLRFRPSYFPFTEPSAEIDIDCAVCHGAGCRSCGSSGWLELLGCGMVHPNVLRIAGYDPDEFSGFAFGMGPDRLAMMKHKITDLRLFRENDLRFLEQFP